ncbi:MAG: branched-chain amino acid ABC transporter permease [Pseudomonadota bacterium]
MLSNPMFLAMAVLNGLSIAMVLFIIAAGLTLILGVLRILNFAHAAFFMLGGYVAWQVAEGWLEDVPGALWLGAIAAGLVLAVLAAIIERTMLRHLYGREEYYQLLFTFALVLLLNDAVKAIWGTDILTISHPDMLRGAADLGITFYPRYRLFLCVVGVVVAVALWLLVTKTRWGRTVRAARMDREMLSTLGVDVAKVYASVFILGVALAGVGGALAAADRSLYPGMDADIIVRTFIIVIIGGLGSLWGAFLGALILGMITSFGTVLVPEFELVLIYLLMIAVLLVRPWGLLGKEDVK